MNRISNSKNLIKKISIFFLFFSIFVFTNIKTTHATILKFGLLGDPSACKDTLASCNIDSVLKNAFINDPKYKFVNTVSSLDGHFNINDYKISDINMSLDNFIKERLRRNKDYGYFGTDFDDKFNDFNNNFDTYMGGLSAEDKKTLDLLFVTVTSNIRSDEKRLEIANNITKTLGNSTSSAFNNEDLKVTTLTYYYLKIYKVLEQYILTNKLSLTISPEANTKLITLKDNLRSNIYTNLYKTNSIVKANGCTTDGTHLELCDLFVSGKFKTDADGTAPDIEFNVMNDVNSLKLDASKYPSNANDIKLDTSVINADPGTRNDYADRANTKCDKAIDISWWFSINPNKSTDGCSFGALLINYIIQGINKLVDTVVNLVGSLFDWIYDKGVINFKDWVDGSGAYIIYKTVILSLIVSVMTFFVFYLIIRRLIDDDGDRMNKILPKLILTALFVYFSFTITGWVIDQSNIITIYLYRSMTHQDPTKIQPISRVFKNILSLDNGGANSDKLADNFGISIGTWDAIPYTAGQLVVSIVAVFVLIEGAILLLSRTIILLLCMIFSPIMLLPEGLSDLTDKYRKIVTDNFTGNILLGPVFMFLVLLAVQIGTQTTKWLTQSGPAFNSGNVATPTNFLGGILSSVLVIVVLQLAISASKSLSGSMGEKLSGVIGKYAGGAAFGGGAKILRNTVGRGAATAKDRGWMMGKEGSGRHKFMTGLYNGLSKSTFDARNTDTFQKAADFSGAGAQSFGKGSNRNYNDSFRAKLYNASKYHNSLDESGKQRNIDRLKKLGSAGDFDSKRIADGLEKKWKPSINERINNDSGYNERFDKAHSEKDETKRKNETTKVINEHFKENGLGAEHFSKEIEKPENNKVKVEYENAIREKDPIKRKDALTKIIADLDKKTEKETGSIASLVEAVENTNSNITSSNQNTTSESRSNEVHHESINSLRSRLQAKYSKEDVKEYQQKRMTMYQEKSLKEAKEKQDTEIASEKEKNGGFIPSAKDFEGQAKLTERLKGKYSKEDVYAYRKKQEEIYQNKVLEKALNGKDEGPDNKPTTPSPSYNPQNEKSNSMSINETGKLIPMHSPEELATLNKNRNNSGDKAA